MTDADPGRESPESAWLAAAETAGSSGDSAQAALAYEACLQANPFNTRALHGLAGLRRAAEQYAAAVELWRRWVLLLFVCLFVCLKTHCAFFVCLKTRCALLCCAVVVGCALMAVAFAHCWL
jgi:lipopolysaccharide export LptBFGC system permease protein LptF